MASVQEEVSVRGLSGNRIVNVEIRKESSLARKGISSVNRTAPKIVQDTGTDIKDI